MSLPNSATEVKVCSEEILEFLVDLRAYLRANASSPNEGLLWARVEALLPQIQPPPTEDWTQWCEAHHEGVMA